MNTSLTKADWQRILQALSHFQHNTAFNETYQKVALILSLPSDDDQANSS